ncbi:hypothetical protein HanIR_Chr04g0158431 [Helianthus annuus]|nr:hypothetical protein HanIR_Chr04g0158431 [Helianthus annuus]
MTMPRSSIVVDDVTISLKTQMIFNSFNLNSSFYCNFVFVYRYSLYSHRS